MAMIIEHSRNITAIRVKCSPYLQTDGLDLRRVPQRLCICRLKRHGVEVGGGRREGLKDRRVREKKDQEWD